MKMFQSYAQPSLATSIALVAIPFLIPLGMYLYFSYSVQGTTRATIAPTPTMIWESAKDQSLPLEAPANESDARREVRLEKQYILWKNTWVFVWRMSLAFAIALPGIFLGIFAGTFPYFRKLSVPTQILVDKAPTMALLALVYVFIVQMKILAPWIEIDTSEFAIIALVVLGIATKISLDSFQRTEALGRDYFFLAQSLGMSEIGLPFRVALPQIWPQTLLTIALNIGPAAVLLLAAEGLVADDGFGYTIFRLFKKNNDMAGIIVDSGWLMILMFTLDYTMQTWVRFRYRWLNRM